MNDLERIIEVGDNFGKTCPNRDQVLEKVYDFARALAERNPKEAETLVITTSMDKFRWELDQLLRPYWREMADEEPDFTRDLSLDISDPHFVKEKDSKPEFSNNDFNLSENESLSMRVAINGEVVPVYLNFSIQKYDEVYFLKLESPFKKFW